jgi:hypothetical protein
MKLFLSARISCKFFRENIQRAPKNEFSIAGFAEPAEL